MSVNKKSVSSCENMVPDITVSAGYLSMAFPASEPITETLSSVLRSNNHILIRTDTFSILISYVTKYLYVRHDGKTAYYPLMSDKVHFMGSTPHDVLDLNTILRKAHQNIMSGLKNNTSLSPPMKCAECISIPANTLLPYLDDYDSAIAWTILMHLNRVYGWCGIEYALMCL